MRLHHHALSAAYYPIRIFHEAAKLFHFSTQDNLRVLLYHDIPPDIEDRFAAQMRWLARSWNFVSPQQFSAMVSGEVLIKGNNLLLTFDDGFASNRSVAEKVLNPMGISALFFVVTDFVSTSNREEAREYIARHILPGNSSSNLPTHWGNLNWHDLEALRDQGHTIGAHTATHARLADLATVSELRQEILASAELLETRLGVPIEHFAYTFGDVASFSKEAMAIARQKFKYIHSGLRGNNRLSNPPYIIRRDSAATQDEFLNYALYSDKLLGAMLSGATDMHYAKYRRTLDSWSE